MALTKTYPVPTTSGEATSGRNYEFSTSHEIPKSWFSRRGEKQIPTTRGGASSGRKFLSVVPYAKFSLSKIQCSVPEGDS